MTTKPKKAERKEIFGWAMFDFANSSYTTVIITVVFSIIFPKLIVGSDSVSADGHPEYRLGNLLWSVALSISYLLVVITAPIFGAIMDHTASKKKFLLYSYIVTIIATGLLYFVSPGMVILGVGLVIISNFGFASGEDFVSAFLPELGEPEDLGKISGYAWGLGYFGGLISTAIAIFGLGAGTVTIENFSNLRMVGPVTAVFFAISAIPTFLFLKEKSKPRQSEGIENYLLMAMTRLAKTFKDVKDYRDLALFLGSYFFSYAGLSIIISFAFIYGDQVIRWSPMSQTLMFVITQITAALGAFAFGFIQDRFGAIKSYNLTMALWVLSVILIYFTGDFTAWMNSIFGVTWKVESVFLFVGSLAGLGLGSTQSASRALVGYFAPESKSGEFFGFWGLFGKLSAIFGILGLGVLQAQMGLHNAILITAVFFFFAFLLTFGVNEKRGREAAIAHEGE